MSIVSYKCPNCGGELLFDPEKQNLKCDYCLSHFTEAEVEEITRSNTYNTPSKEVIEDAGATIIPEHIQGEAMLYTCPNCGAQIITEQTTSAMSCYYCHSPISFTKQLSDEFRPSKVIPFKISKQQALDTFLSWQKDKHFLPNDFASPSQLENTAGIYIPFWLVDCHANGSISGTGKKIKSWHSGDYRYTQTDIYSIKRSAAMNFSYLPHDASTKAEDKVMESIGPYEYSALEDFSYSYLSGFLAEKYDVSKEDVYPTIKQKVEASVGKELLHSVSGYQSTSYAHKHVQISKTRFHYTLMPVWMLTYLYKGQTYIYAMNGQTGKTFGSMPLCSEKLNVFSLVLFTICFAIILLILLYFGGITL